MPSIYSVTTEGEEAIAAAETLVQLRGATTVKAKIREWGVSFDGTSATAEPVVVRLLRQTTDGTASAATEVAWDPDNPTANCTSFHSFSAEPTAGEVLETHEVHPQAGMIRQYLPDCAPILDNAATSRIAIEVTPPAAVNAVAFLVWEE